MGEYYTRYIESKIADSMNANKIIFLLGARQTGKSTLLNHLLPEPSITINLQNPKERTKFERNPNILEEIINARPEPELYVLIDEIQKVPSLLDLIQYIYDERRQSVHFLITGSSARKLIKESANLLPGRSHLYRLFPVSQLERQADGILPISMHSKNSFKTTTLANVLLYGGLPVIEEEEPHIKSKTLESYVEIYIEEEIRRENLVKDVGLFTNFLELAAIESGKPINYSKLSNETGISINSIKTYYQILVDTFIGYYLPAYTKNQRKRVLSTPKFLFFDNGVRNACAKWGFSESLLKLSGGDFFEHWVGLELYYKIEYLGAGYKLFYYRTVSGAEIDYIVKAPDEIIPVEVKFTENPHSKHASEIEKFISENKQSEKGFVVCRCSEPRQISKNVTAIPWNNL